MSVGPKQNNRARSSGPQPHFVPKGWFALLDAFDLVGRDFFPDSWACTENRLLPPEVIAAAIAAEEKGEDGPCLDPFANASEARAARLRAVVAWDSFRKFLNSGAVRAVILRDNGTQIAVPEYFWAAIDAEKIFFSGKAKVVTAEATFIGWVLVSRRDLAIAVRETAEAVQTPAYLSPYMAFMIRVSGILGLSEDTRKPKAEVEDCLRENWPAEFGRATQSKIGSMATFLRNPEDAKGGHFKVTRKT